MAKRKPDPPSGIRPEHRLSEMGSKYSVWAESARVMKAFDRHRDELDLDRLLALLQAEPLKRVVGKTKKLRGTLAGVIQYDLPDGNRAQYVVEGKAVVILYVGRHPKAGG